MQTLQLVSGAEGPAVGLESQFKALLKVCKVTLESDFIFNTMLKND